MSSTWYRAFQYPSVDETLPPYRALMKLLLDREHPPDVSVYRCLAADRDDPHGELQPTVVVLGDDPPVLDRSDQDACMGVLGAGRRVWLDPGAVDVFYRDWGTKRGSGPPIIEKGRNDLLVYAQDGPPDN